MLAQVDSAAIRGIDAFTVQVEVDCAPGFDPPIALGILFDPPIALGILMATHADEAPPF